MLHGKKLTETIIGADGLYLLLYIGDISLTTYDNVPAAC